MFRALRMTASEAKPYEQWVPPMVFVCLAGTLVVLGGLSFFLVRWYGPHVIAHIHWNNALLMGLTAAVLVWQCQRHWFRSPTVASAGLGLAAFGLAARGVVELAMVSVSVWPPIGMAEDATPVQMVDACRWLGLAAYFVGLTLFAVEVIGYWVDRRRAAS